MSGVTSAAAGARVDVQLSEWATLEPAPDGPGAPLWGLSLENSRDERLAEKLSQAGVLKISEMRHGLRIESTSFVGRIAVGPIDVTIAPKLAWNRWRTLLGYAMRLKHWVRTPKLQVQASKSSLHDLLVLALVEEVGMLLVQGLHREYETRRKRLAVPKGRVDFKRLTGSGIVDARLPCRFARRDADTTLNRAVLGGLQAGLRIASDPLLRSEAKGLVKQLTDLATTPVSEQLALEGAWTELDRRTIRYAPALSLTQVLLDGMSVIVDDDADVTVTIPGFAIDMNALWQRLLGRVLTEWCPGGGVREEQSLKGVFRWDYAYSPKKRHVPIPRPDFALCVPGGGVRYLDAKYRDLWEHSLPREMLYQLALYASTQDSGVATMLYPTEAAQASEERLDVCRPGDGMRRATVVLRPVNLARLEALVVMPNSRQRVREREQFAKSLLGVR